MEEPRSHAHGAMAAHLEHLEPFSSCSIAHLRARLRGLGGRSALSVRLLGPTTAPLFLPRLRLEGQRARLRRRRRGGWQPDAPGVRFVYAPRRVDCPSCGVVVEATPWAAGESPITSAFARFLASWAQALSWGPRSGAARRGAQTSRGRRYRDPQAYSLGAPEAPEEPQAPGCRPLPHPTDGEVRLNAARPPRAPSSRSATRSRWAPSRE